VPQLEGKTIAILGLAFKPETDDIREAPALKIIEDLLSDGAKVRAYDPAAIETARRILPGIAYCEDEYEAARGSDVLVVVTEWNQFRRLDMPRLKEVMREPNIVDLRNIYEPETMRSEGFNYLGMGRN
jgi:UDPglucose 6-dehydrogenase